LPTRPFLVDQLSEIAVVVVGGWKGSGRDEREVKRGFCEKKRFMERELIEREFIW
jgi:hypothetical protein